MRTLSSIVKSCLLVGVLLAFVSDTRGGEKFRLSLLASPSLEWTYFAGNTELSKAQNDIFGSKYSYNFGFEYEYYVSPGFGLSLGLQYQNKGFRNETSYTLLGSDETDIGITIGSARYLIVPAMLNFHLPLSRRSFITISTGALGGFLLTQTINNRNYANEFFPEGDEGFFGTGNGKSNTNLFNNVFVGGQIGMGFTRHIRSRLVLDIQPIYRFQVNKGFNADANTTFVTKERFNSLALEIKVGYYFSKQIDRKNKDTL